jgi:hypothetical protein
MTLRRSQTVWVRCNIQPGAFSHERLVTIQSCDGPVSGFVRVHFLDQDSKTITGKVVKVEKDRVLVKVPGSFFTTNGVTSVSQNQLRLAA